MESNTFEKCFSDFIDRHEYDEAQNALFDMVRISFKAGWQSAGGDPPPSQTVFIFRLPVLVIYRLCALVDFNIFDKQRLCHARRFQKSPHMAAFNGFADTG